jgi:hypothetical protein
VRALDHEEAALDGWLRRRVDEAVADPRPSRRRATCSGDSAITTPGGPRRSRMKRSRVSFRPQAEADLFGLYRYIAAEGGHDVAGAYAEDYNQVGTHLALAKDTPLGRPVQTLGSIAPLSGRLTPQIHPEGINESDSPIAV